MVVGAPSFNLISWSSSRARGKQWESSSEKTHQCCLYSVGRVMSPFCQGAFMAHSVAIDILLSSAGGMGDCGSDIFEILLGYSGK
jgi:hypothetical protein